MAVDMIMAVEPVTTSTALSTSRPTTTTLTCNRKQKVGFFSLPGELRNRIYRLVLPKTGDIVLAGMP